MLDAFEGKHREEPRAKTTASANPVILEKGKDLRECTTEDCEALARGNAHGLCHGCWATAYEERRNELLGAGVSWQDAAKEIKETATSGQKRKTTDQIEMRGKKPGGPKETSIDCSSFFTCADGACPHKHFRSKNAGKSEEKDKKTTFPRRGRGRHFPTRPRRNRFKKA